MNAIADKVIQSQVKCIRQIQSLAKLSLASRSITLNWLVSAVIIIGHHLFKQGINTAPNPCAACEAGKVVR